MLLKIPIELAGGDRDSWHFDFRDGAIKPNGDQEDADESDDDAVLSETLRDLNVMNMDRVEEKICQVFRKYGASMVPSQQQHLSVFSSGTGITVAKIDRTKHINTPSMKGIQGTPQPSVVRKVVKEHSSVIALGKKMSVLDLQPNDRDIHDVTVHVNDNVNHNDIVLDGGVADGSVANRECDHGVCTSELQPPLINEVRDSNIFTLQFTSNFFLSSSQAYDKYQLL